MNHSMQASLKWDPGSRIFPFNEGLWKTYFDNEVLFKNNRLTPFSFVFDSISFSKNLETKMSIVLKQYFIVIEAKDP